MWFDTHAHLFLLEGPHTVEQNPPVTFSEVIQAAIDQGVTRILCVGIDVETSRRSIKLARQFPDRVWAAVGIHPNSASSASLADWDEIVELARDHSVVAIGETGLDWYRDYTPPPVQVEWFEKHWALAKELGKPLVVHCRDAEKDITEILSCWSREGVLRAVMHACAAPWEVVSRWLDWEGIVISFAGSVTYKNTKFAPIRETAQHVPSDRILVETDCPYLVPEPYRGRVKASVPLHVKDTGYFLAKLRGVSPEELAAQTTDNAIRTFGISPPKKGY
ncbi:TatD family hydrolase [Thermogutta sp.]|uniref:TatD family hydrolase n=1 Tax=Thermogutta sp. TaxID=1962930 RepID=UPI00322036EA